MLNSSLIFEGLDGTGKSSLCQKIFSVYPHFLYHHFAFPMGEDNTEKYGFQRGQFSLLFDLMIENYNTKWLLDRAHIGEHVWSPKYRNRTPTYLDFLEKKVIVNKKCKVLLVNVICDSEVAIARVEKRNAEGQQVEKVMTVSEHRDLQNLMTEYCQKSFFNTLTIDTTKMNNVVEAYAELMRQYIIEESLM